MHIMFKSKANAQQESCWKAVENLVDSHAAGMVQRRAQRAQAGADVIPRPCHSERSKSLFRAKSKGISAFAYTATTAAWYSSYAPLKSVILWSLSKCQMRVATSSIRS